MKITLPKLSKTALEQDLLILTTFKQKNEDKKNKNKGFSLEKIPAVKDLESNVLEILTKAAQEEGFNADEGQHFVSHTLGLTKIKSLSLLGLGQAGEQTVDLFRRAGGEAYKLAQKKRAKTLGITIPKAATIAYFDVVQALVEGIYLAKYKFSRHLTKDKQESYLKEVDIYLPEDPTAEQKLAIERAQEITKGVCFARDLINEGPSELNPSQFAKAAAEVAKECGLKIDVLDEKKLKKENMNLLLSVARAAEPFAPPRLIKLHYQPLKPSKQKLVLVGKGVTFDSGGLDIKTAEGMLDMKVDMSGAAAVLGTMYAVAQLKPKTEVIGYLACVENGVGPQSYHPGDIIVSRKGISVEINNTDAEGRLILADTINYATEYDKPDIIIDVATLTGACMIALGPKTAGLFANDDTLADALKRSGKTTGEDFWRMPLNPALKDMLKSSVADMKNTGERYGGAITAALFLSEFIEKGISWAHLDIAGPATNNKPHAYLPTGGVGFAVRTLTDFVMGL